jgi:hypothetical protein
MNPAQAARDPLTSQFTTNQQGAPQVAVSKRLRYEILRRDNFTCRYCMTATPGTPLRVDHVVPVALGGTDDATNLVTSCEPCNSGKTSTVPDSPLVAQVREDAMRWQMAWAVAVAEAKTEGQQRAKDIAKVKKNYVAAYRGRHGVAPTLPEGWESSVGRWLDLGLPLALIDKAIASAVGRTYVPAKDRFAYFAGCCWSLLRELKDRTEQIAKQSDGPHEGPQEDEDEYDERNAVEHAIDSYSDGWHLDYSGPSATAEQVNAVAAFAKAASAAGYERLSIACAAFNAGTDHNGDPNAYLETVDSVLGREAERIGTERPYGSMGIPVGLLPTPEDQAERAVTEAAVAAWRLAWHYAGRTPPGRYSAASAEVHSQALDAFRSSGDAQEIMRGAEHAGAEGSIDLLKAVVAANEYNALEPAISAWHAAYCAAMGSPPAVEAEQNVWSSARTLRKNGVWDHQIITAATFAGAHATTRMHFGLSRDEAKTIGVKANTQRLEDCWARSWFEAWGTWPSEEDRAALRARLLTIAEGEAHQVRDIAAAVIAAGAYQSADLYPSLTRSLSTFEAAARLPDLGGGF